MKLLVLAQSTPPKHGQSRAVARLLEALADDPKVDVVAVELSLSREMTDVGRWRIGKIFQTFRIAAQVIVARVRHGPRWIYYVPAPGKRGALYRDWVLLTVARTVNRGLILHWHAVGLGAWLGARGTMLERAVSHAVLDRADIAIVQTQPVQADAEYFRPVRCLVIPNGIPDPLPNVNRSRAPRCAKKICTVFFAGLGCESKGLFDALEGVARANQQAGEGAFRLEAIGAFASPADARRFQEAAAQSGAAQHFGFVSDQKRDELWRNADIFCLPSYYPHEGQPAVLLEALAHDLPIITTRWRGIPENLPDEHVHFVAPKNPDQIAEALLAIRQVGTPNEKSRRHYLDHFTLERHHRAMSEMFATLA